MITSKKEVKKMRISKGVLCLSLMIAILLMSVPANP